MENRLSIGNTPLIKINYKYDGKSSYIYTKLEYYNLTGSIKDRVAYAIINNAKKRGTLKEGMPIIEATSGNTGIALAALGSYYGHPVTIYMPDWASQERVNLMRSYGAEVILVSKEEGGFIKCVELAKAKAKELHAFLSDQFRNEDNFSAHFDTTGEEIVHQLPEKVGGFVSGVGTGGTLMGVGKRLKKEYENFKIIALEPDKMPMISQGIKIGPHKIEGIGDDFVPKLVDVSAIDEIILINDMDAINMSRKLAKELGLGVGISSGANFLAGAIESDKLGEKLVTVFADDNKKYLSTDLMDPIDDDPDLASNHIQLLSYEFI